MQAAYDSVLPINFDTPTSAMSGIAAQHSANIFPCLTIIHWYQDREVTQ